MELLEGNGIVYVFQAVIAFSVLRVWLINRKNPSNWRAGNALTLKEEFEVYDLPEWIFYTVGFLKITFSIGLLAGFWMPETIIPSAAGIAFLMLSAVFMHIKVKDPIMKSFPAFLFLLLSILILLFFEN